MTGNGTAQREAIDHDIDRAVLDGGPRRGDRVFVPLHHDVRGHGQADGRAQRLVEGQLHRQTACIRIDALRDGSRHAPSRVSASPDSCRVALWPSRIWVA